MLKFMNLPAQPIRAICFDLDGTMFNTEDLYWDVGHTLLSRRNKQVTRELLDEMMGRPSRDALQIMIDWHGLEVSVPELQVETKAVFVDLLDTRLAPMPGLMELLNTLADHGLPCAIATSSGRSYLDDVLGRFGLSSRFTFTLTGDDVHDGKPHPEIYQTAIARFGIAPSEMLVLEDSANGCRAALAAGAYTIAVPGEHSRRHDFAGVAFEAVGLTDARIYQALGIKQIDVKNES